MTAEAVKDDIRSALLNRDFERAQSLIEEWGKLVAQAMKAATSEAERREILDEALALGEQSLYLARVIRAHISSDLLANSASFLYVDASLEQPRWHLNG